MLEKIKFYSVRVVRFLVKFMIIWIYIALVIPVCIYFGKRIYHKYPNFHFVIFIDKKGNRIKVFLLSCINLVILFIELITLFTIFVYIGFKMAQNKNKSRYVSKFKEYIKYTKKPVRSDF